MGLLQPSGRPNLSKPNLSKPKIKAKAKIVIRRPSNPKKFIKWLYILLLVILVGTTVFYYFDQKDSARPAVAKNADPCAFFTLDDAKKLLGNKVQKGGLAPTTQASTKDISVITCVYTQDLKQSGTLTSAKSASVMLLKPKTNIGKIYNKYAFNDGKQAGVQDVSNIGEKAFWDPATGTLNVLKNTQWVILSNGVTAPNSDRNVDDAKKLAAVVVTQL
jgi:hypothetical protein